jgi:malonyl-CoA O-methyltransferase
MPDPLSKAHPKELRQIDAAAVARVLRRLGAQPAAPWLHSEVARRMAERLALIRLQPARIIDWWSFLGASHELLSAAYPKAQRVAVEPSAALAQRSRLAHTRPWWALRRAGAGPTEVMLEAELGRGVLAPAQLVWANMMLHAVKDPPALVARWQQSLSPEGFVMFSCLGPDTLRELRSLYRRLGWLAPTIAFVDMHDLGDMLVQAGFADPVMDQETITLSWSDPRAMLHELRLMGGNVLPGRGAALRTPRWKARLEAELMTLTAADGRLHLSFEIAYGHAFKALPRVHPGGETSVSLDDMRSMVRTGRPRN